MVQITILSKMTISYVSLCGFFLGLAWGLIDSKVSVLSPRIFRCEVLEEIEAEEVM